jgi:glutathione peroxidase
MLNHGPVLDHAVNHLDGTPDSLSNHRDHVLLIFNSASACGYTPQLKGLQALHEKYAGAGLEVIGVPCNDFGAQEPGSADEIAEFCQANYGVGFLMLEKMNIAHDKHPLYRTLTEETGHGISGEVKWNFTKFLVDRHGHVVARFEPKVAPDAPELIAAIEALL